MTLWWATPESGFDFIFHPRITSRLCLLLILASIRGAVFLVEQPSASMMVAFPYIRWMSRIFGGLWQQHRLSLDSIPKNLNVEVLRMESVHVHLETPCWTQSYGKLWAQVLEAHNYLRNGVWTLQPRLSHLSCINVPMVTCGILDFFSVRFSVYTLSDLSPWAARLKKKLTKKVRKRAKKNSKKNGVTRKYKDKHGRTRVCLAWWLLWCCGIVWSVVVLRCVAVDCAT